MIYPDSKKGKWVNIKHPVSIKKSKVSTKHYDSKEK